MPAIFWLISITVLAMVFAQARAASPRYSITPLRAIATAVGTYTTAYDINDNGIAVGVEGGPTIPGSGVGMPPTIDWTRTRPMRWDAAGNASALATLPGKGGEALAINNAGLIVGYSAAATGGSSSTVFGATATAIPNGGGRAVDVNDSGTVLGFGGPTGNFRYLVPTGTFQALGTGSNQSGWEARTISPAGRMFANRFSGMGLTAGELFQAAAPSFLFPPNAFAEFRDVNTRNVVAGAYAPNTSTLNQPAIFNGSSPMVISVSGAQFGSAAGINDRGMVILSAYNAQSGYQPYVYDNGVVTALNTLLNNASQWTNLFGMAVNNRGQIVGQGRFDHDNNPATPGLISGFRLDPIRTPGDTNHDNKIDFADLLILSQNFGQSGNGNVFWETGDFNFDWAVNFDDLLTLSQRYSTSSFESDWALARSIVPEPVTVLPGLMLLLAHARRRK